VKKSIEKLRLNQATLRVEKLRLNRETLRSLNGDSLAGVHGGTTQGTITGMSTAPTGCFACVEQ
jgi:hypothetical protein